MKIKKRKEKREILYKNQSFPYEMGIWKNISVNILIQCTTKAKHNTTNVKDLFLWCNIVKKKTTA